MRWLALGSIVVLGALMSWAILSASNGSSAGMVAANSGSIAVVLAWVSGHVAITKRIQRLAADGSGGHTVTREDAGGDTARPRNPTTTSGA